MKRNEINLTFIKHLYYSATKYYYNNEFDLAIKNYLLILNYDQDNYIKLDCILSSDIYSNISACYLKTFDYLKSLHYALKSINSKLDNSKAWGRVGWSYKGLKISDKSYESFKIANKLDKSNKYYISEINFYESNIKLNKNSLFSLFSKDKYILNKLKNKNIMQSIMSGKKNNDIRDLLEYIIIKLI